MKTVDRKICENKKMFTVFVFLSKHTVLYFLFQSTQLYKITSANSINSSALGSSIYNLLE